MEEEKKQVEDEKKELVQKAQRLETRAKLVEEKKKTGRGREEKIGGALSGNDGEEERLLVSHEASEDRTHKGGEKEK